MENYWELTLQTIFAFSVLSIVIERALYQLFNMKIWDKFEICMDKLVGSDSVDLKPWISIIICSSVVFKLKLDMIATLFNKDAYTSNMILTGLFLSGGSTTVYEFLKNIKQIRELKLESTKSVINKEE